MSKITVLLCDAEFERFDAYCEERGFKKSTLISRLIREHLEMEQYHLQTQLEFSSSATRLTVEKTKQS